MLRQRSHRAGPHIAGNANLQRNIFFAKMVHQPRIFHRSNPVPDPLRADLERIPNALRTRRLARVTRQPQALDREPPYINQRTIKPDRPPQILPVRSRPRRRRLAPPQGETPVSQPPRRIAASRPESIALLPRTFQLRAVNPCRSARTPGLSTASSPPTASLPRMSRLHSPAVRTGAARQSRNPQARAAAGSPRCSC